MNPSKIFLYFLVSLIITACYKPSTPEEKEFVNVCKETKRTDRECGCIYSKLKDKYSHQKLLSHYKATDIKEDTKGQDLLDSIAIASFTRECN